jgi:hypothetical protein
MIRRPAAAAAFVLLSLSACDRTATPPEASEVPEVSGAAPAPESEPSVADGPPAPVGVIAPASPGAPEFAVLYPGAELEAPPTTASGASGNGGLVTFRTDATPDEVVAFYEQRAATAGLRPVMGMSQGDARAFGASAGEADGAKLQVVAAPDEGGATSVQLSWSSGR